MTTFHRHHIVPKHAGGSNDPSNLIIVTIAEHAELHKQLWEKNHKIEDYYAWQGLLGNYSSDMLSVLIKKAMKKVVQNPVWRSKIKKNASKGGQALWSKPGMREHLSSKRKAQINPMQGKKQKLASCVHCRKELSVNLLPQHSKKCAELSVAR